MTRNKCSINISSTNCYLIRVKVNCVRQPEPPSQIPLTGRLKQQGFISHSFGGSKSKIKELPDSVPGEDSPPGLQTATFSLCPRVAFPVSECGERGRSLLLFS